VKCTKCSEVVSRGDLQVHQSKCLNIEIRKSESDPVTVINLNADISYSVFLRVIEFL
jgi:hypothetical protein